MYSYLIIGVIESGICTIVYFHVFLTHGIPLNQIPNKQNYFIAGAKDLVIDGKVFDEKQ